MKVIGVRFRRTGRIYYFDPLQFDIVPGCNVIVETARGIEFGTVITGIRDIPESMIPQPLKPVIRLATEEDVKTQEANAAKEKDAFKICLEKIAKHNLEMKLIECEYTFDNNKLLYYFTADGRVDFRELVKDLAAVFKTRIELRQIGVRDETKILGGIGICGRPLCCHSYLSDFIPVSIKMAKEQNLSLNPTKISGVCGRLMCCLKNEEEAYEELNSHLPAIGETVMTPDGLKGEVKSTSVLKQLVKVLVSVDDDEKDLREYKAADLKFKPRKKNDYVKVDDELRELEQLEEKENKAERRENRESRENNNEHREKRERRDGNQEHRDGGQERREGGQERRDNRERREHRERREGGQERRDNFQKRQNNNQSNNQNNNQNNNQ